MFGSDDNSDWFRDYSICIWVAEAVDEGDTPYGVGLGGIYTGIRVIKHLYNESGINATNHYINQKVRDGQGNSILAVTMMPSCSLTVRVI